MYIRGFFLLLLIHFHRAVFGTSHRRISYDSI